MAGVIFHVLLGLTTLGVCNRVSALICLSCHDVGQPNLCEYFDVCEDDEVCIVQEYLQENEVRYSLGCSLKNMCGNFNNNTLRSTDLEVLCQECCTGDFCNSGGCKMPGFPATRGPICYNCDGIKTYTPCHRIKVCNQYEECYYSIYSRFGYENTYVDSKCQRSHVCDVLRAESTVIGRRQVDLFHNCAKCCATDLCNNQCDDAIKPPYPQLTTKTTTTETTTTPTDVGFSMGNQYLIMFLNNIGENSVIYEQILFASDSAGWCTIQNNFHNTVRNISIVKGINLFNVTRDIILHNNLIENKFITIESSIHVSAYALNHEEYTSDGYFIIPTSQCSTWYIIPSYEPYNSYHFSVFGLASLQNDTVIIVTLRLTSGVILIDGHSYRDGDTVNITLEENETFQFASNHDLTGTELISSKPVCVVSGTQCANVGDGSCNHLSEMIFPVNYYSDTFVIPILQTRPNSEVRVLAKENQTLLTFNNQNTTLNSRDYHTLSLSRTYSHSLSSNKPVSVMLYAEGLDGGAGDPFMMTIPSVTQYLSDYIFAVVDAGFTSYLSVIVQKSEADGLQLDNRVISPIANSAISISLNGSQYTSFAVNISPGYHRMNHTNNEPFGLFVYGNRNYDGYGYPAGINL